MAYINAETTKKIRDALKLEFPCVKFAVKKRNNMALYVNIMRSPFNWPGDCVGINHYHLHNYGDNERAFLEKLLTVIKTEGEWFDNSDIMTDYFHTAFYIDISVGEWKKPHVKSV